MIRFQRIPNEVLNSVHLFLGFYSCFGSHGWGMLEFPKDVADGIEMCGSLLDMGRKRELKRRLRRLRGVERGSGGGLVAEDDS